MPCSRIIVAPDAESVPAVLQEFYRNLGIEDGCRYEIRNIRIDDTLRQIGPRLSKQTLSTTNYAEHQWNHKNE